jgi:hypothetical protein
MGKKGDVFDSVVEQIRQTDTARLSAEYGQLRDHIVHQKVMALQTFMVYPPVAVSPPLWDSTLMSPGTLFQEARGQMHA